MAESTVPAGWYDDGTGQQRWWDGSGWTEQLAELQQDTTPMTRRERRERETAKKQAVPVKPSPPSQRLTPSRLMWTTHGIGIGVLIILVVVGASAGSGSATGQVVASIAAAWVLAGFFIGGGVTLYAIAKIQKQKEREAPIAPVAAPATVASAASKDRYATPTWHRAAPAANQPSPVKTPAASLDPRPSYPLVGASGYTNTEVVGEFARLSSIHAAIGRKPKRNEEIVVEGLLAELRPEPSNPYDQNAVMVVVNGHHVGYLAREEAAVYQPVLMKVAEAGFAATTGARIWAVARHDWNDRRRLTHHANVRVALNPAHLVVPLNDPPAADHSILPWGKALQVTGEENHQDVLSNYVTPEGDGIVLGTLHVETLGTARTPKELIEIRIDGERIGQLTPGSSQHFIPTVRHLEAQGLNACAWLRVKGSAIAAQATIQATKAHELPSDWFTEPHSIPRLRNTSARSSLDSTVDDAVIRSVMREPMWGDD